MRPVQGPDRPSGFCVAGVKVLDFGLAKVIERAPGIADHGPGDLTDSPTMTSPAALSAHGVILGTAAYMSPEQARGKPVDRRADIWAFGCVLFEMLTGIRAFTGETVTDVLAAVIEREPDWPALPAATPPTIRRMLQRCLVKDPTKRLPHIGAARLEIDDVVTAREAGPHAGAPARPASPLRRSALVAVAILGLVAATWAGWAVRVALSPTRSVIQFDLDLPVDRLFTTGATGNRPLAVSPDGSRLVYFSGTQLYLRALDGTDAVPIQGTEDVAVATHPFFSPDGRWLAFVSAGRLRKVLVAGGRPETMCAVDTGGGGSWGADDRIVFADTGGIYRVSSTGGTPERVITLEAEEEARRPQVLPEGGAILYSLSARRASWNTGRIVAQAPGRSERVLVVDGGFDARFVSTGHLVYGRNASLYSVPFDPVRLAVTGDPVRLADGISMFPASSGAFTAFLGQRQVLAGSAVFSVAGDTLVYSPVSVGSRLVWVDRTGSVDPIGEEIDATYHTVRLAPDGRRAVADIPASLGGGAWVHDLVRRTRSLLVPSGGSTPGWTPGGARVTYRTPNAIVEKNVDGTGGEQPVIAAAGDFAEPSWSPDGKLLLVTSNSIATGADVAVASRGGIPQAVVATRADERAARFSPDGRLIAYQSDESGRPEIYVQPFPGPGPRVLVSTGGGTAPVWARDGSEVFYHEGTALMAAPVLRSPTFDAGTPVRLFDVPVLVDGTGHAAYDIAADGRFLMIQLTSSPTLRVVVNWLDALRAKAALAVPVR